MRCCFTAAASSCVQVLAHRGHHWVLLQNAARALWNAVTSLIKELDCMHVWEIVHVCRLLLQYVQHVFRRIFFFDFSYLYPCNQIHAANDYLVGAVYGLSCHCLYHASMGLCDLISSCGDTIQWEKVGVTGHSAIKKICLGVN